MTHSPLAKAFLSSMLVHLTVLLSVSSFWGALRLAAPQADLIPAELVMVAPPPPVPEPVTTSEVTPLTPPEILSKTDVMVAKPPPPPPEPLVPSKTEPVIPPRAVEKPPPKRPDVRQKPPPAPKHARPKAPELPPGPPPGPDTTTFERPKPGPPVPVPDAGPAPAGSNALGPSPAANPADQPTTSVEGGEAGAGELAERGDLPVVPGTGGGGGSGGPGRAGLGWGAEGDGVRTGNLRPGAGGEGPGGGVGSLARPLGGYQLLPRYPESARRQGITGTTQLLFEVLANGTVGAVQVERSAGHPDLDQAAAEAIKKWRFEPARRGNQPVAVWLRMPVRFVLR
jgi:periplasmic protein TonB